MSDEPNHHDLADQKCVPCRGDVPPLEPAEIRRYAEGLDGWDVVDDHHLVKRWKTKDFQTALDRANRFGAIAEREGHHPELRLSWGWVEARIWTHAIDGLAPSDFYLAAKYDRAVAGDG